MEFSEISAWRCRGACVNRWCGFMILKQNSHKVGLNSQKEWTPSHGLVNGEDSAVLLGERPCPRPMWGRPRPQQDGQLCSGPGVLLLGGAAGSLASADPFCAKAFPASTEMLLCSGQPLCIHRAAIVSCLGTAPRTGGPLGQHPRNP